MHEQHSELWKRLSSISVRTAHGIPRRRRRLHNAVNVEPGQGEHMNRVERLEGRTLFASYAAASATELIASMTQANSSAEADTITLPTGATFTLTAVDNVRFGPTGLPSITEAGGSMTILGDGSTIERSSAAGTPVFRLFDVDINASLTLSHLTVRG